MEGNRTEKGEGSHQELFYCQAQEVGGVGESSGGVEACQARGCKRRAARDGGGVEGLRLELRF